MRAWRAEVVGSGFAPAVWSLLFVMAAIGCTRSTEPGSEEPSPVTQQTSALSGTCNDGTPCPFSIVTPSSLTPASLLLSATSTLKIDDRVTVKETNGNPATIANLGTATLQIGTDGHLGDIWSRGPVTIGARTIVNGTINGAVTITSGTGVTIKAKDNKSFTTTTSTSEITFPTTNAGAYDLEPGGTGRLSPGSYGAVAVKSRSKLSVTTGSYLLESLDLEPQSTLALNTTAGPIVFYVRTSVILRGTITSTTDARDFTLVYFGSTALAVEAPFNGTIVAPSAQVNVTSVQPLNGAFFAAGIEVYPGNTVTHVASRVPVISPREGPVQAGTADGNSGGNNTGTAVTNLSGGDWVLFRGVDFGKAGTFDRIQLNIQSPSGTDQVLVNLDSLSGTTIGTLPTFATGASFVPESAPLTTSVSGVHDLYLIFNGSENAALASFQLTFVPPATTSTIASSPPPPDAGGPSPSQLVFGESGDMPDTVAWVNVPPNVTIPANGSDGVEVTTVIPTVMFATCDFTGAGPLVMHALDHNNNVITPATQTTIGSRAFFITNTLPAQKLGLLVQNSTSVPVTVNCALGFAPPPS
jgi:hypothetical protein